MTALYEQVIKGLAHQDPIKRLRIIRSPSQVRFHVLQGLTIKMKCMLNIIATGYGLYDRGFNSRWELEIFLLDTTSRPALGPTQPPTQRIPGALSVGVKRPEREADHSPPSSARSKNEWSYNSTPQYGFMAWCLVKRRDNFTFTFLSSFKNALL
jgi:hypothetical protein